MKAKSHQALLFAGIFAVLFASVPAMLGELFPFTNTPMFRDSPQVYAAYHIVDDQGQELDVAAFGLHRNYDGNPVGLGTGIHPHPTMDVFGEAPPADEVAAHVRSVLRQRPGLRHVDVTQVIVGPTDERRVGVIRDTTFCVLP